MIDKQTEKIMGQEVIEQEEYWIRILEIEEIVVQE